MKSICGCNCNDCKLIKIKNCDGCRSTCGCPFGKKCWIANYIEIGGIRAFEQFKQKLIDEFNALNIESMPKTENLYNLQGNFVNFEYQLENGEKVKFVNDNESYLGNQIESLFNDIDVKKCFGLLANTNILLVCEYEENDTNLELIVYKKR